LKKGRKGAVQKGSKLSCHWDNAGGRVEMKRARVAGSAGGIEELSKQTMNTACKLLKDCKASKVCHHCSDAFLGP
jgi:hypothetical protein